MSKAFTYIPSAYKAGTAYVPIPNTAAGDYDFSRNSVASRVDENGDTVNVPIDTPVIDYSDGGCPVLLLNGGVCGNSQQVYNPNSLVWKLNMAALSNDGTIRQATINNGITDYFSVDFTSADNEIRLTTTQSSTTVTSASFILPDATDYNNIYVSFNNGNIKLKANGIYVSESTTTFPSTLTRKDYNKGDDTNLLKAKIQSDTVSEDLTTFDSVATSVNEILNNSKLTIR